MAPAGRRRYLAPLVVLFAFMMPLAGLTPGAAQEEEKPPWEVTVPLVDVAFEPSTLIVKVGTKVTWVNEEPSEIPHDVQSDDIEGLSSGPQGEMAPGDTYSWTFGEVGDFTVYCQFHTKAVMNQRVIVTEDGGPPAGFGEQEAGGWFANIDIRAGHIIPHRVYLVKGSEVTFTNKDSNVTYDVAIPKLFGTSQKKAAPKGAVTAKFAEEGVYTFTVSSPETEGHAPTVAAGEAIITVTGDPPEGIVEITEVGVNYFAYWIGLLSFGVLILTLVFLFFYLKYGESPFTTDQHARNVPAAKAAAAGAAGGAGAAAHAGAEHTHTADFHPVTKTRVLYLVIILVLAFFLFVLWSTRFQ